MRELMLCASLLLLFVAVKGQPINGTWYSRDGSRTYTINKKDTQWEAMLTASRRPGDEPGKIIVAFLTKTGKKYKGIIRSLQEGTTTAVTIKQSSRKPGILYLKLHRMVIFAAKIRWYRFVNN